MESESLYFDLAKGKGAAEEDEPALAPEETVDSWRFSWLFCFSGSVLKELRLAYSSVWSSHNQTSRLCSPE
ncbi:hypothetical protein AV530_014639 [Patagioenas fasciata monilis]|uniref:Uncharacterized protein n=1 Tax=Patagioenas fasciata monilis TaxID=372326 RepID=A0A1V4KCM2_PATFA|nr:hypothetical protein AV530_014639 [Patagioenas fasciata monilis]